MNVIKRQSIYNLYEEVLILILVFCTLFPITLSFLPGFLSTRVMVAGLGIILILKSLSKTKVYLFKKIRSIYILSFIIAIWSFICTAILHHRYDYTYVTHPYTITMMLLSTYACTYLIRRRYKSINYNLIVKFFIGSILLQSAFTLFIFLNPNFAELILGLQHITERNLNVINFHLSHHTRFIGLGLMFYTASFFYGTALIFIAYRIRNGVGENQKKIYLNYLLYIIVAFFGMGLSRTTIVGIILSGIIIILPRKFSPQLIKRFLYFLLFLLFIIVILFLVVELYPNLLVTYQKFIDNVFQFIITFLQSGELESSSLEGTKEYFILPQKESTYLFGTGIYDHYSSIGDFNYSDVGYLRLLYYFGIIGLILYFVFQIYVLNLAFKNKKIIFYTLVLLLLIINYKGLTTLSVIAFFFIYIPKNKKISI